MSEEIQKEDKCRNNYEGVYREKLLKETNDLGVDYSYKVKDICFICKKICNKEKDYSYYCAYGNMCRECSSRIGKNVYSKEGIEYRKNVNKMLKEDIRKSKEREKLNNFIWSV